VGIKYTSGPWWLGCRKNLKEDGCERNTYKGDNFDDKDGIFSFE
jgi:hypothetical protein